MLNPRSLSLAEADEILAHKRGPRHDSWGRIAQRAGVPQGNVDKLVDICRVLVLSRGGLRPRLNIERWIVEAVLGVIRS